MNQNVHTYTQRGENTPLKGIQNRGVTLPKEGKDLLKIILKKKFTHQRVSGQ